MTAGVVICREGETAQQAADRLLREDQATRGRILLPEATEQQWATCRGDAYCRCRDCRPLTLPPRIERACRTLDRVMLALIILIAVVVTIGVRAS